MYEKFYNLVEPPFSLTPDPKYFYRSESHHRAFELLRYAIQRSEGFMLVYGDIGTGKTTLCRTLIDTLDSNVRTALLLNPFLTEVELLKTILEDFGVSSVSNKPQTRQDLVRLLTDFLTSVRDNGGRALVLIDEAQNLPLPTLEQIRILSNLGNTGEKLLQMVLVGQLEVMDVLAKPALRQLLQHISIKCELSPLTAAETSLYVRHRLAVAGSGRTRVTFTADGLREIYRYSGGLPRLINQIADRSLLAGMALSTTTLDRGIVREAVDTLHIQKTRIPLAGRWPFLTWSAGSK